MHTSLPPSLSLKSKTVYLQFSLYCPFLSWGSAQPLSCILLDPFPPTCVRSGGSQKFLHSDRRQQPTVLRTQALVQSCLICEYQLSSLTWHSPGLQNEHDPETTYSLSSWDHGVRQSPSSPSPLPSDSGFYGYLILGKTLWRHTD